MSTLRQYFAEIGRRGGIRSRRVLDSEIARRMVQIREARRTARRAHELRLGGTAADTTAPAQAIQDALLKRVPAAGKLAAIARLSRMVDQLAMEGLRQRHAGADVDMLRYRHAELRLGRELTERVYGPPRDVA